MCGEEGKKRSSFSYDSKYWTFILGKLENKIKIQSHFGMFDPVIGEGQWYDDAASHALKCTIYKYLIIVFNEIILGTL